MFLQILLPLSLKLQCWHWEVNMWQANIIAHSISPQGKEVITYELIYPRIIHAEIMTHKMLSKNAASSRAIPVSKVIDMVRNNPAMPIRFGANQAGMQDKGEEYSALIQGYTPQEWWDLAAKSAARFSEEFNDVGYHKQVANRITEPFQWMKTVMTGTEWENFFWLRKHEAADPTLHHSADLMFDAYEASEPVLLESGEWHLPYYQDGFWKVDIFESLHYPGITDSYGNTLEQATNISMSCCAQVSYRTLDDTLEKAERVVDRLNLGKDMTEPVHASPSEHQCTPMKEAIGPSKLSSWDEAVNLSPLIDTWEDGITAYHKQLGFMSGNLAGWVQKRQLISGHTRW